MVDLLIAKKILEPLELWPISKDVERQIIGKYKFRIEV